MRSYRRRRRRREGGRVRGGVKVGEREEEERGER